MNKQELAQQLRLAADLIETGHPWECRVENDRWIKNMENDCPLTALAFKREMRLALATPPDGRPLHNPDNLTAEQVGAGWRLTLKNDRKLTPGMQLWSKSKQMWNVAAFAMDEDMSSMVSTYRLPLSVPWPEASKPEATTKTVPLGPDDVPPCSAVKGPSDSAKEYAIVCGVGNHGIILSDGRVVNFNHMKSHGWQINRSIPLTGKWDATAWEPCHKTIPAR